MGAFTENVPKEELINNANNKLKIERDARQKDINDYRSYVNGMLKIAKAYYVEGQKIEGVDKTKTAKPKSDKSDADRANRESLEALKQQYKDQKDAIENKYKLQLKAVEDNIKLAKDDPYLSSVEKNQKQMELYSQMININKEYYDKLIENAKDYNSKAKLNPIASPNDFVNTTDFMTNRDTEAQGYQTAQTGLANQLPEDAKKDLDAITYKNIIELLHR